jgi:hypothetical protein
MLLLDVDDILIVGKNVSKIARLKRELSRSFAMKILGFSKVYSRRENLERETIQQIVLISRKKH